MRLFFLPALALAASVLTPIALLACGSSTSVEVDAGSDVYTDQRPCKTKPSVDENDLIEGKDERCCGDGLVPISKESKNDAGMCWSTAPPSLLLCTYCGDGKCTPPETDCNCEKDCH